VFVGAIDDQVGANRPEQHKVSGEVFASMAHAGARARVSNASNSFPVQRSAASMLPAAMYSQISSLMGNPAGHRGYYEVGSDQA
jgi:hypothetical protein